MRISSSTVNRYINLNLMKQQVEIAELQNQIGSGKKLEKPSDDPVNASRRVDLSKALSQIEQYQRNASIAETRLVNEERHLVSSENALLRIRELALISNNAATSPTVYPAIITELEHLREELLAQANAKDADGNFVFSGTKTSTQPFNPGSPDIYLGDDQERLVQINQNHRLASGHSGKEVFMRIPDSSYSHTLSASSSNTGDASGLLSTDGTATIPDTSQFEIRFTATDTYDIVNLGSGGIEVSGAALPESGTISFNGLQIQFTGTPATNDTFQLNPGTQQNIFATISEFTDLLQQAPNGSAEKALHRQQSNNILEKIDLAFEHMTLMRAETGNRLSSLDTIREENEAVEFQLTSTLSGIEDLDYTAAISALQQRTTALEALQKSISLTQNLSLFNL